MFFSPSFSPKTPLSSPLELTEYNNTLHIELDNHLGQLTPLSTLQTPLSSDFTSLFTNKTNLTAGCSNWIERAKHTLFGLFQTPIVPFVQTTHIIKDVAYTTFNFLSYSLLGSLKYTRHDCWNTNKRIIRKRAFFAFLPLLRIWSPPSFMKYEYEYGRSFEITQVLTSL